MAIAWYLAFWGAYVLCVFTLSLPVSLSLITIIAAQLLFVICFISLFVSSYRPTQQLGCGGWLIFLLFIIIINATVTLLLMSSIVTHSGRTFRIVSSSMYPTIKSMPSYWQDRIMVNSLPYRSSDPRRGDIVFMSNKDDFRWIKRVVGLPGETVDICSPYVLINGKKLLDPPIFATISSREEGYFGYVEAKDTGHEGAALPVTLGSDEYFLLGDNSSQSWDSRHFGPVPREAIKGKVTRIVFPPWRIQEL
jgi:signal peptidase I